MENIDRKFLGIAGIYLIKDNIKNKVYVGSTCNLYKRINNHIKQLRAGIHHTTYLQNHFNKYGESCFCIEIVETIDKIDNFRNLLFDKEQVYLDYYYSNCFNSHHKVQYLQSNEEVHRKQKEAIKEWWKKDKNTKIAIPLNNLKLAHIANSLRWEKIKLGEIEYVNPNKGKKATIETKQKQSNSAKARGRHIWNLKPVFQYTLEGKFIKQWETGKDAAREILGNHNISTNIYRSIYNKNYYCNGFIWTDKKYNGIVLLKKYKTINILNNQEQFFNTTIEIAKNLNIDPSVVSRYCYKNNSIKGFLIQKVNDRLQEQKN